MTFFEDLAQQLDARGIESRVAGSVMHVSASPTVELAITVDNEVLPAARVAVESTEVDGVATLLSVVFSVRDAVDTVSDYLETAESVLLVEELVDDPHGRLGDLDFYCPVEGDPVALAPVGRCSHIQVEVSCSSGVATADVGMVTCPLELEDVVDDLEAILAGLAPDDPDRYAIERALADPGVDEASQMLSLGQYTNFDRLLAVLPYMAAHAADWEAQLLATAQFEHIGGAGDDVVFRALAARCGAEVTGG